MRYKKYFLIMVILISGYSTFSQRFNGALFGGMSTSQIDGDTQEGFDKLGFFAGVSVSTDFTKVIGAKIELYYIGKGAKKLREHYSQVRRDPPLPAPAISQTPHHRFPGRNRSRAGIPCRWAAWSPPPLRCHRVRFSPRSDYRRPSTGSRVIRLGR